MLFTSGYYGVDSPQCSILGCAITLTWRPVSVTVARSPSIYDIKSQGFGRKYLVGTSIFNTCERFRCRLSPFFLISPHIAAFDSDCLPFMPARHLFSTGNPKNSVRHSKARLCALRGHLVATIWTMVPRTCEPFFHLFSTLVFFEFLRRGAYACVGCLLFAHHLCFTIPIDALRATQHCSIERYMRYMSVPVTCTVCRG
jgi:hypothetical protein